MEKHASLIKKIFWCISLPFLFVTSVWCFVHQLNPLDNIFFLMAVMTAMPLLLMKTFAQEDKTIDSLADDFRKMGATEFLSFIDEFRKMPLGKFRAYYKEAYRQVYLERYGKDIFNNIPGFGD